MGYRSTSRLLPDGITLIEVSGELTRDNAPELRKRLINAVADGEVRLIVDMTRVGDLDSVGLGAVVGGMTRVRRQGGNLIMVCRAERLLREFRLTGLDEFFHIVPDVASARERYANGSVPAAPSSPDRAVNRLSATSPCRIHAPSATVGAVTAVGLAVIAAAGAAWYWLRRRRSTEPPSF